MSDQSDDLSLGNTKLENGQIIRTMVRSVYDFQDIRIQMGNRIVANWKSKLGLLHEGLTEKQLEAQERKVLKQLRNDYNRITDAIIEEGDYAAVKIPKERKFKGTELISSYAELILVDQYVKMLTSEQQMFRQLNKILLKNQLYSEYLQHVDGIGPAMAGVILSEIDLTRATYPSSLWMVAGLDTVLVGKYKDETGKEHIVPGWQVEEFYATHSPDEVMMAHDRYEVKLEQVGRSKKEYCLIDRQYKAKDGEMKWKKSITFNPFLKTKLVGVLAGSFLKAGTFTVDGKKCGKDSRLKLAEKIGFQEDMDSEIDQDDQVVAFLRERGYEVIIDPSPYAKVYYNYRERIDNDPRHAEKTKKHRHFMACRYAIKIFLNDYYKNGRTILDLPVMPTYAEAKLGLEHKQATPGKEAWYRRQINY